MESLEHGMISDINPIDIAETLAERRSWDFDRVGDDQIAFTVEGAWRAYSLTMAWCGYDETLRLICSFEMNPPEDRLDTLYRLIERANDVSWAGMFNLWRDQSLMVYRYGLILSGGALATPEQIDAMMRASVTMCEQFYPAFQLVAWGDECAEVALAMAMSDAVGRA